MPVKRGMLSAEGRFRIFLDIDLSTPLAEFEKFLPYCGNNGLMIGTRNTAGARLVQRQPFVREMLGKGFVLLARVFLGVRVSDFNCGFKCFSRSRGKDFRASNDRALGIRCGAVFSGKEVRLPDQGGARDLGQPTPEAEFGCSPLCSRLSGISS